MLQGTDGSATWNLLACALEVDGEVKKVSPVVVSLNLDSSPTGPLDQPPTHSAIGSALVDRRLFVRMMFASVADT